MPVSGAGIGHVHGDRLVDIPFPKKVREGLVAAGRAEPHHILPESGWVSICLRQPSDVERSDSGGPRNRRMMSRFPLKMSSRPPAAASKEKILRMIRNAR